MPPNFSLTRTAQGELPWDGFAAYRWVHWLVKVATGAAFTVPAYWLGGVWWALGVAICSLLICKSFRIQWTHLRTTWTPHGLDPFTLDFVFDFALNLTAWLVLAHVGAPVWLGWLAALALYPWAHP